MLFEWAGTLPRFAPLREGGPGKPASLVVMLAMALALVAGGIRLLARQGMDGAGPVLFFLGCAWLLFLAFWVFIKAGLRGRAVSFVLGDRGVEIVPSARQERMDRWMRFIALITFLFTRKGGQWSAWHPYTPWKDVRRVEIDETSGQIVVGGGAWDIRLICGGSHLEQAHGIILDRIPPRAKVITTQTGGAEPDQSA